MTGAALSKYRGKGLRGADANSDWLLGSGKFCGRPNGIVTSCPVLLVEGEALAIAFDNDNHGASPAVSFIGPWPHFFLTSLSSNNGVLEKIFAPTGREQSTISCFVFPWVRVVSSKMPWHPVERFCSQPEPAARRAGLPCTQRHPPMIHGSCILTRAGRSRGAIPKLHAK